MKTTTWQFKSIVDVQTGEVRTGGAGTVLVSSAIGSCVAVTAIDTMNLIGGIAHIMLPGKAPRSDSDSPVVTRYAENGFADLLERLNHHGACRENLRFCIAGAANVLMDAHDTICRDNINSVYSLFRKTGLTISAQSIGGFQRRKISLDIEAMRVLCAIGDEQETILWQPGELE